MGLGDNSLGKLIVEIEADVANLSKGLEKAKKLVKDTEEDTSKRLANVGRIFAGLGIAVASGLALAVKATVDYNEEIFTLSKRTGISTETLSKLKFVADQTESSIQDVAQGLRFLSKNIFEASQGNQKAIELFERLNVNIRDASGNLLSADQAFLTIADRFKNLRSETEKNAVAMELFGRNGLALRPILELGSEGIQNLSDRAEKLGLVLTKDNAQAIDDFDDKLKELKAAVGGASLAIGTALIPALTNVVEFIKVGVLPIIDNLNAAFVKTKEVVREQVLDEALSSVDPVLENMRRQLFELQEKRDELQKTAKTSGGRGTSGQEAAITDLVAQEERLREAIVVRMQTATVELEKQAAAQQALNADVQTELDKENLKLEAVQAEQAAVAQLSNEELTAEIDRINQRELIFKSSEERKTEIYRTEIQKRKEEEKKKEQDEIAREQRRQQVFQTSLTDTINGLQVLAKENKAAAIAFKVVETGKTIIAGARAFTESLPNFALAALVAAATAAKIAVINSVGFAKGSADVPEIGGVTHPGEIVVPETFADAIREGKLSLGGPGVEGGKGKGDIIFEEININVAGNIDEQNREDIVSILGEEIETRLRGVS